nr:alanine:cation symporter family protein [Dolosigranulum pigrum]
MFQRWQYYILGGLITVVLNIDLLIPVLRDIVVGAFKPEAIYGGALGIGMQTAIRFGLARGLFSNEAGMGSTPHSHAIAKTDHPVKQGFIAMIGVFMSTFVICLTTVMMNLMSGSYGQYVNGEINQIIMTQTGFSNVFGQLGGPFLSIALAFFSLTTIVGWSFFAEANVKFITSNKWVLRVFRLVVFGALFAGQYISGEFVWELADMAMGMMALPNIIALFFLTKDVVEVYNDYKYKEKNGLELTYDYNITINPDTKTLG